MSKLKEFADGWVKLVDLTLNIKKETENQLKSQKGEDKEEIEGIMGNIFKALGEGDEKKLKKMKAEMELKLNRLKK